MYKKLTEEYEGQLFKNYNLTELMLMKKGTRKIKLNENSALNELLRQKLEQYGLYLFGQFERDDLTFRGIRMLDDFPIENEPILKQLYGYTNFTAHIQIMGFDTFAVAFDYNTETGECELQRHSWGEVTDRIKFKTLAEMLEHIRVNGYKDAFTNINP